MRKEPSIINKDWWERFKIIAEVSIAIIALAFTISFGVIQWQNIEVTKELAISNLQIAKAQEKNSVNRIKSALLPSLSSENPKQRAMALYLANVVDEPFATEISGILARNDPNKNVRQSARLTLDILSQSKHREIKQNAEKNIKQYDIVNELREKGFLKELKDAQGYLASGNFQDKDKALEIYHGIVKKLPPDIKNKLNQELLAHAEVAYKKGHRDDAVRIYSSLFADFSQASL